jgi:hypothetical protein
VTAAVLSSAEFFERLPREEARRRSAVIASTPELQERELIKMAALTAALADALRNRGVDHDVAALAAETGVGVFKVAFERWIAAADDVPIGDVLRATLKDFSALTA